MAFVRLNEAVLLESVLEVPVPVRFIFVLLGPSQSNMDYHEIGRSFSTLMSDKVNRNLKRWRTTLQSHNEDIVQRKYQFSLKRILENLKTEKLLSIHLKNNL